MVGEPAVKRTIAFVDGQNLFYAAKEAFGYHWPNYDVLRLVQGVCTVYGWTLVRTHFYTGVPSAQEDRSKHDWWSRKLAVMGRQGIVVFQRLLRYRDQRRRMPDGTFQTVRVATEKGIDVRLALDVVRLARRRELDVALIFSQDQDLSEVADEIHAIAREQGRWIKIACAFPDGPLASNHRGINRTDWIRVDRNMYDACLDYRDYRRPAP